MAKWEAARLGLLKRGLTYIARDFTRDAAIRALNDRRQK